MMYLQWLVHGKPDAPKKVTPPYFPGLSKVVILKSQYSIDTSTAIRGGAPAKAVAHVLVVVACFLEPSTPTGFAANH